MKFWPMFLRNFTYSLIIFACAAFVLFPFVEKDRVKQHTAKKKPVVGSHVKAVDVKTKIAATLPEATKTIANSEVSKKVIANVDNAKLSTAKQEVKQVTKQGKPVVKQEVKTVAAKPPVKTTPLKKPKPAVKQKTVKKVQVKAYGYHKVSQGENLWRIAQKYGTSATAIAYANHIHNFNSISAGQTLIIPVKK